LLIIEHLAFVSILYYPIRNYQGNFLWYRMSCVMMCCLYLQTNKIFLMSWMQLK
jgi:hypothetical protein